MPIYEYRCDNGHEFEALQRMTDEPLSACKVCEATAQRVMSPVAVHFKGSGFYATDYGRKGQDGSGGDSPKGSDDDKGKKPDSDKGKKSESSASSNGAKSASTTSSSD